MLLQELFRDSKCQSELEDSRFDAAMSMYAGISEHIAKWPGLELMPDRLALCNFGRRCTHNNVAQPDPQLGLT